MWARSIACRFARGIVRGADSSGARRLIPYGRVLKVYISYGSPDDQVTALRLQALAAVNGLKAYVPPAHTRRPGGVLDENSKTKLLESEVVLGTVGGDSPSDAWREECRLANERGILRIHIAPDDFILMDDGKRSVGVSSDKPPDEAIAHIRKFLSIIEPQDATKRKILLDLSLVALGLVRLAPQD
jgi:hypothetical protein